MHIKFHFLLLKKKEKEKLGRTNKETKGKKLQCLIREERQKEKSKEVRESLITELLKHQHFHGVKVKVAVYADKL